MGKKDACYHKVKSRYKVWPSAYGSGALSKCRKVGAANWGNSKKKTEGGVVTTNREMVKASNGVMVPKANLKDYEQSLAKLHVGDVNKKIIKGKSGPAAVFKEVAGVAMFAPIRAVNFGRNLVRTANAVNKTKKSLKLAKTANTGYGTYKSKYGG